MKRVPIHLKKWGELRGLIRGEQIRLENPMFWIYTLIDVIENRSHVPKKYKWPMGHTIVDQFIKMPSSNIPLERYLTTIHHEASILRHQGYGEKRKYMSILFTRLLYAAEAKIYEKTPIVDKSVISTVSVTS